MRSSYLVLLLSASAEALVASTDWGFCVSGGGTNTDVHSRVTLVCMTMTVDHVIDRYLDVVAEVRSPETVNNDATFRMQVEQLRVTLATMERALLGEGLDAAARLRVILTVLWGESDEAAGIRAFKNRVGLVRELSRMEVLSGQFHRGLDEAFARDDAWRSSGAHDDGSLPSEPVCYCGSPGCPKLAA